MTMVDAVPLVQVLLFFLLLDVFFPFLLLLFFTPLLSCWFAIRLSLLEFWGLMDPNQSSVYEGFVL